MDLGLKFIQYSRTYKRKHNYKRGISLRATAAEKIWIKLEQRTTRSITLWLWHKLMETFPWRCGWISVLPIIIVLMISNNKWISSDLRCRLQHHHGCMTTIYTGTGRRGRNRSGQQLRFVRWDRRHRFQFICAWWKTLVFIYWRWRLPHVHHVPYIGTRGTLVNGNEVIL